MRKQYRVKVFFYYTYLKSVYKTNIFLYVKILHNMIYIGLNKPAPLSPNVDPTNKLDMLVP